MSDVTAEATLLSEDRIDMQGVGVTRPVRKIGYPLRGNGFLE